MRIRSIKPEFWADEVIGSWPFVTRLAYIALWNEADDQGRLRCNIRYLHCKLFPYDATLDFAEALRPIIESKKLIVYEVNGQQYGFLTKFLDHQAVNRPTSSRLPGPNGEKPASLEDVLSEGSRRAHGGLPEDSRQEGNGKDGEGKESKRKQKGESNAPSTKASGISMGAFAVMTFEQKQEWYERLSEERPVMNKKLMWMVDELATEIKSRNESAKTA